MAGYYNNNKFKIVWGGNKIKKGLCGANVIYSGANPVTYYVDSNTVYTEEIDEGDNVLSPTSFTPSKSGWMFVGWRTDKMASSGVLSNTVMGDSAMTLYAVFKQTITVTYYNNSTTASTSQKDKYYNNGNVLNPSFSLSQSALSGWTARGWSTSNSGNADITYNNGVAFTRNSNVTLYGLYQQTITLTTVANGTTSTKSDTRYCAPTGYINPTFTVANPAKSGATFKGWSASASSTTISNSSISNLTLTANTTRYAVFSYTNTTLNSEAKGNSYDNGEEYKTYLTIDGTKYSAINVTVSYTYLEPAGWAYQTNAVLGLATYNGSSLASSVSVRAISRVNDEYNIEDEDMPCAYGKSTTVSLNLANATNQQLKMYPNKDVLSALMDITTVIGIGRTVVG